MLSVLLLSIQEGFILYRREGKGRLLFIQFLAELAALHQDDMKKRMIWTMDDMKVKDKLHQDDKKKKVKLHHAGWYEEKDKLHQDDMKKRMNCTTMT